MYYKHDYSHVTNGETLDLSLPIKTCSTLEGRVVVHSPTVSAANQTTGALAPLLRVATNPGDHLRELALTQAGTKHGRAQSVGRQPVMKAFSHASDRFESLPGTANVCEPFLQPYTQSSRREEQRLWVTVAPQVKAAAHARRH
jgi:hypothetical protein